MYTYVHVMSQRTRYMHCVCVCVQATLRSKRWSCLRICSYGYNLCMYLRYVRNSRHVYLHINAYVCYTCVYICYATHAMCCLIHMHACIFTHIYKHTRAGRKPHITCSPKPHITCSPKPHITCSPKPHITCSPLINLQIIACSPCSI
jgi:hypothetical protein